MATRTWRSDAATGNWGTAGNWEEAAVPVDGDDVYVIKGAVSITAGLTTAITPASFNVGGTYTGSVGNSAADPLIFVAATAINIKLAPNASNPTNKAFVKAGNTTRILVDCANPNQEVHLASSGTVTDTEARRGKVYLESGAFTNYWSQARDDGDQPDDNLTTFVVAATVAAFQNDGGHWYMTGAGTITDLHHRAVDADGYAYAGTVTRYWLFGDDDTVIVHNTTATCTAARIVGGTIDCSQDPRAKTFTDVYKGRRGAFNVDNGGGAITITNGLKTLAGAAQSYYGMEAA